MARPTILVGIGSGGLRSIEAAWKLSQEIADPIHRPLVEYIYLETDQASVPISSDIVLSSLAIENISASRKAVEADISATTQWLSGQTFPDNVFNGAGGSPVLGRMTLWDRVNRNVFILALQSAQHRLTTHSVEKPLVYVVGSLGGGTGSGIFLDVAYMIRDALANQVELHGLFMVPNLGLTDDVIYSNTVCSLKELDYYMENNSFPFKWSANPPCGYQAENKPYELVQIISASYDSGLAPVTYSRLHEEAGLFLYLNALGMYDTRRASLVDASGNVIISNYTTFGISAIHYPESEIKDYISNKLSSELLSHLIDEKNYFDSDYKQYRSISAQSTYIRNSVKATFDKKFKKIIEQWCGLISIVEGSQTLPVEMHLETLASSLASPNSSYDEKRKSLYNFFRVGGDYYQQLKTYSATNAEESAINLVIEEVKNALNVYQNINVADIALESIEESLMNIQNYWRANGYTTNPQDWNDRLKEEIVKSILPMPLMYTALAEKKAVYYDRLKYNLLYGLAMHIFSSSLSKIIGVLKGQKDTAGQIVILKNSEGIILPAKWKLAEWKSTIKHVIDSSEPYYKSCNQVMKAMAAKMTDPASGNIAYIFPEGDMDSTLRKVEGDFCHTFGQDRSITDITENNNDLFEFLLSLKQNVRQNDFHAEVDLYNRVISAYRAKVNVGDFSVSTALNDTRHNNLISLVAKKSQIPHLPVNPAGRNAIFEEHKNIPHILVGYAGVAGDVLTDIENNLRTNLHLYNFRIADSHRNTFSHIGLNNWLIFYQEYGRMSDSRAFNIIDDLRDFKDYSNYYVADYSKSKNKMTEQEYHGKRMPYISYDSCHALATKYLNTAQQYYNDREIEESLKYYRYAMYWEMSNTLAANRISAVESELNSENPNDKLNRYIEIADKYFAGQKYSVARDYYIKANNIDSNDPHVRLRFDEIDNISERVAALLQQGDEICQRVNERYEECIKHPDPVELANCARDYEEVLKTYKRALELSNSDNDALKKVANIERRIRNINN